MRGGHAVEMESPRGLRWRKEGKDSDRFATEIAPVSGSKVQFLDRQDSGAGDAGEAESGV